MKQTNGINNRTQTGSVPVDETAVLPVRHLQASSRGPWPKAGVIALLLGTGLLTAMGQKNQPQYRFVAITLPVPSEALGINDSGLVTGAYLDPVRGGLEEFLVFGESGQRQRGRIGRDLGGHDRRVLQRRVWALGGHQFWSVFGGTLGVVDHADLLCDLLRTQNAACWWCEEKRGIIGSGRAALDYKRENRLV